MKSLRLHAISLLILAAFSFSLLYHPNYLTCQVNYRDDINISAAHSLIRAQVAGTEATRALGLGGRACIGPNQGMLFVFDQPGYYPFWMKDMKFSIDILWLSSDKRVVFAAENVPPSTFPQSFTNTAPAKYVLEIQAGRANSLGIGHGTQLHF